MNPWTWALVAYAVVVTFLFVIAMCEVERQMTRIRQLLAALSVERRQRTPAPPKPSGLRAHAITTNRGALPHDH